MRFRIHAACGCSRGKVRSNNEDNFLFAGRILPVENEALSETIELKTHTWSPKIFAVYDGMGGESHGERASYLAAKTLGDRVGRAKGGNLSAEAILLDSCMAANEAICQEIESERLGRMGTTAAILHFHRHGFVSCNIGDSRIFRYHSNSLSRISVDHISKIYGSKHQLTQHLGIFPQEMIIEPSFSKGSLEKKDRFLICSDGLTDMVPEKEIESILGLRSGAVSTVEKLVGSALGNGGVDNITVILIDIL
jgi:protein phosphatase